MAEEIQGDKILSRIGSMLEYFGVSPGSTSNRFGTAEESREILPEAPEMVAEPPRPTSVLEAMSGQEMPQRSVDTLDAARSALENYRTSRGKPPYEEDLV